MSNLISANDPDRCGCELCETSTFEAYPARKATVGELEIRRALPVRQHRLVGPWCFLDRYGPLTFTAAKPMDVAPHPHIGLQTVSWLLDGEVLHRDSLGYESMIRPGELNLMTAGRGIAHAEETPRQNSGTLSGVQLWVALPEGPRNGDPAFEHHAKLPVHELRGGTATVILGEAAGLKSPAKVFSEIVGLELKIRESITMPLKPDFEHALFVLEGSADFDGQHLEPDILYYLGTRRDELALKGRARVLLVGGKPFGETIVMWWNFVGRSHEDIATARQDWENHRRFGEVTGYRGPRLAAPPLHGRASPPAAS